MKCIEYFIFLVLVGFLFSCEKEEPKPKVNNIVVIDDSLYDFTDIDWSLYSGRFYMENMSNGEKTVFNHFGNGKLISVLDPINGCDVRMDTIITKVTKWRFSSDKFILNGTDFYDFTHTNNTISVIGLENGSSRPITIVELNETSLTVIVHEAYGSIDGVNYRYYTTLTFIKKGETCDNCEPSAYYGYTYNGVVDNSLSNNTNLTGTTWVVTKFYDGFSNNYPNDTLRFINNGQYTINNGSVLNYTLSNVFGNNMSELTLYSFFTMGGDYSGFVPDGFVSDGQINSASFTDIFNTNNDKIVWMTRIN